MAEIVTRSLLIDFSKLEKTSTFEESQHGSKVITDEKLEEIKSFIELAVAEIINDAAILIEVTNFND